MACFTVPLATAAVVEVVKGAAKNKSPRNPFVARLGWLVKLMLGGSFLLAVEHVWHGEVVFRYPFLTAVEEGPEAVSEMLREMAVRGSAMAGAVFAVWCFMVAVSARAAKKCEVAGV